MPSNDLFYYLKRVERRAGLIVSSSFPVTATDEQQITLDAINAALRYLVVKHYLIFKHTEYTLTTTAGVTTYNLRNAPYNQTYWRVSRLAEHGVRRADDDFPLDYISYQERDMLRPSQASQGQPRYYSSFGNDLIIHPPPDGSQVIVRYYGLHIGTDSTGTTQKQRLSATGDLTMLEDEWEDLLVDMAALRVRGQQKVDEKYQELKKICEEWENILLDMANQPGEDAAPQIVLSPYSYNPNAYQRRYYPFFTDQPGA